MKPNPNAFAIFDLETELRICLKLLDNHHLTKNNPHFCHKYTLSPSEYSRMEYKIKNIKVKLILLGVNPDG